MSDIRANTISDASGNGPINLHKQSAAKAYANFDSDGSINESLNISSATDVSPGSVQLFYTNSFASNYSIPIGFCQNNTVYGFSSYTTTYFKGIVRLISDQSVYDRDKTTVVTHGDLA